VNDARLTGQYADAHDDHEGLIVLLPATPAVGATPGPPGPPVVYFHPGHDHADGQRIPGVARYTGRAEVVALVAVAGAWNWRRATPAPGAPGGVRALRRSATMELAFGAALFAATAALVATPLPGEE
jgi:hypothetical protein